MNQFLRRLHARPMATLALALLLSLTTGCSEKPPSHPYLPWDIQVFKDGTSAVFGVHLGKDPLLKFKRIYNQKADLALFADKNKHLSLEAYFGSMYIGPLSANVVLVAEQSQKILNQWADQSGKIEATPSGAWKLSLPDSIIRQAQDLPIRSISYAPKASFSENLIRRRFGKPARIVVQVTKEETDGKNRVQYWLYPNKGLLITLDQDGKDLFQYIAPRQFDLLRKDLPGKIQSVTTN